MNPHAIEYVLMAVILIQLVFAFYVSWRYMNPKPLKKPKVGRKYKDYFVNE